METNYMREATLRYGRKRQGERVTGPDIVARLFRKVVKDNTKEHFVVFHLDGARKVASYSVAHVGTANLCHVHPREVFQPAILSGACTIVVAHSHPSGALDVSTEDAALTDRLSKVGELVGIRVLDSVIVTDNGHRSILP